MTMGALHLALGDEAVDRQAELRPIAVAKPADARGQAELRDTLASEAHPAREPRVVGEHTQQLVVEHGDVAFVARERGPAEGPHSPGKQGPHVGGHEARVLVRAILAAHRDTRALRLGAQVVAVVEGDGARALHRQDRLDVRGDRGEGAAVIGRQFV